MSKKENLKAVMELMMSLMEETTSTPEIPNTQNNVEVTDEPKPYVSGDVERLAEKYNTSVHSQPTSGFNPFLNTLKPTKKRHLSDVLKNPEKTIAIIDKMDELDRVNNLPHSHRSKIEELERENKRLNDELNNKSSFDKYYNAVKENEELRNKIQRRKYEQASEFTKQQQEDKMEAFLDYKADIERQQKIIKEKSDKIAAEFSSSGLLNNVLKDSRDNKTEDKPVVMERPKHKAIAPKKQYRHKFTKHSSLVDKALKTIKK